MTRSTAVKKYGKPAKRSKAERLFAELPQSPVRPQQEPNRKKDSVSFITNKVSSIHLDEKPATKPKAKLPKRTIEPVPEKISEAINIKKDTTLKISENRGTAEAKESISGPPDDSVDCQRLLEAQMTSEAVAQQTQLRTLTWEDVCPPEDRIEKIAEASYAEVYRVTNERGTSIIKVIRLPSPIKPQTKAQIRSGLVDEEPHPEEDVQGELQISEWLADIPGFVVYKERYVVQGKTTRQLLETHQSFQKKMKRQDPDRAQFYPSPSRYLEDTRFLVVELGDAGTSLEDWKLTSESQLWDIFLLEAIALARAEDLVMFEVVLPAKHRT
jgi:serine/threonine-protein kinase haspin